MGSNKYYFLPILCLIAWWITPCYSAFAQNDASKISGFVVNKDSEIAIEKAVVRVFNGSELAGGTFTDETGKFILEIAAGQWSSLSINALGYEEINLPNSNVEWKKNYSLGIIPLTPNASLGQITITDDRPAYQVFEDKKVYQVDKDPLSATGSTADILQNIPSVNVDQDGNVKLRGASVTILIDGKPSGMMGMTRREALDFIPANMIESIEVMNNPSSKYDSGGEGGIINIILKKPKVAGFNFMALGGIGTGDKYNGSIMGQMRTKKLSITVNASTRHYAMIGYTDRLRQTSNISSPYYLSQHQDWKDQSQSDIARARMEYRPNDNNEIGAGVIFKNQYGKNYSYIFYKKFDVQYNPTSYYDRNAPDSVFDSSLDYTFNFTHRFKTKGHQISANALISGDNENTVTQITQQYYGLDLVPFAAPPLTERINEHNVQHQFIGQIDYDLPINKNIKLETGLKTSYRYADLDYQFLKYNFSTTEYFSLPQFTNQFKQLQRINASYLTYRHKLKYFSYKIGLRAEQTIVKTELVNTNTFNNKNYINLFPSLSILKKFKHETSLNFNYSNRINRPNLRNLNPFYRVVDASTARTGNPNLKPEFTQAFELGATKYFKVVTINSSIYYRKTLNTLQRVTLLDSNQVAVTTYDNFKFDRDLGFEFFATAQVNNWYRLNAGINFYHNTIDGSNINPTYQSQCNIYNLKVNNYFTIDKKWIFQWAMYYQSPIVSPLYKSQHIAYTDLSLKREFFNKRLILSLRMSDALHTRNFSSVVSNAVYHIDNFTRRQSQIVFLTITFRPSAYQLKSREDDGNDEENNDDIGSGEDKQ